MAGKVKPQGVAETMNRVRTDQKVIAWTASKLGVTGVPVCPDPGTIGWVEPRCVEVPTDDPRPVDRPQPVGDPNGLLWFLELVLDAGGRVIAHHRHGNTVEIDPRRNRLLGQRQIGEHDRTTRKFASTCHATDRGALRPPPERPRTRSNSEATSAMCKPQSRPAASQKADSPSRDASWSSTTSAPPRAPRTVPSRAAASPDRPLRFHEATRTPPSLALRPLCSSPASID